MDVRPLRTEEDYDWALGEIEAYFDREPRPGTPEADRFDVLSALIEAYEAKHWPIEPADPIETVRQVMESRGFTHGELGKLLGSRSRASEVMRRRRALTVEMIRRLSAEWHIPAEALVQPYHLER